MTGEVPVWHGGLAAAKIRRSVAAARVSGDGGWTEVVRASAGEIGGEAGRGGPGSHGRLTGGGCRGGRLPTTSLG